MCSKEILMHPCWFFPYKPAFLSQRVRAQLSYVVIWDFTDGSAIKNPPANAGDIRDVGSILGSERSSGGGNDNPLQYSCPGNPIDRGSWRARVHGVTKSRKQLSE